MKRHPHYFNRTISLVLLVIVAILSIVSGCLFHEKKQVEHKNRQLIIQNDSVMSANIELLNALQVKDPSKRNSEVLHKPTSSP